MCFNIENFRFRSVDVDVYLREKQTASWNQGLMISDCPIDNRARVGEIHVSSVEGKGRVFILSY